MMDYFLEKFLSLSVWIPDGFAESADGLPLATQVSDLFSTFPYHRLPVDNQLLAIFLRPYVVVGAIVLYLLSETPMLALQYWLGINPKSLAFQAGVTIHNFLLALFSFACAYNTWLIVIAHFVEHGFVATYCDANGSLWRRGLGAWSTIFYLSKYWEFIDTWILVWKGKGANFLQIYHHAGIVFCMYGGVASQGAWLLFVVLLNSVIHTFMYTYFTIKTIAPHVEIKSAKYLTMAQIGQFLIGMTSTYGVLWMGDDCDSASSRFSLACLHMYGIGLIALFVKFANKKYKKS
jgi:hypothetical protein